MQSFTQANRFITISDLGLGEDAFLVTRFHGAEEISGLFDFTIEVLSQHLDLAAVEILGRPVTVTVHSHQPRYFSGYVGVFTFGEMESHNLRHYQLTLIPWLWFLSHSHNCRIFQRKTAKSIVSEIFENSGFRDFSFRAVGGKKREYCVQYNESDLDFVSRLLEEEGISYYFEHAENRHRLILVDQPEHFEDLAEPDLKYSPGTHTGSQVTRWVRSASIGKDRWTLSDYNFEEPTRNLLTSERARESCLRGAPREHYEHSSCYRFDMTRELARIRMEAAESGLNVIHGSSNCSGFTAGARFRLAGHDTASEPGLYVLKSVEHVATDASHYSGEGGDCSYSNQFTCVPHATAVRPAFRHCKPVMPGPQSAIVVGPPGEEIYTDEYGRIKVQFPWDRLGQKNEHSSCFMRVMQGWAGNRWGASFIPRIGHEVVVSFLDGDPDRPVVTGSLVNARNRPVYRSRTQSGIRTRSTPGGGPANFNELRFDDKKGSEEIYLHAERDLCVEVEHDQQWTTAGNCQMTTQGNVTTVVEGDAADSINGNHQQTVKGDETRKVEGQVQWTLGGLQVSVGQNLVQAVDGSSSANIGDAYRLRAQQIVFEAAGQIVLQAGASQIVLSESGDIAITGTNVIVNGALAVTISGASVSVG